MITDFISIHDHATQRGWYIDALLGAGLKFTMMDWQFQIKRNRSTFWRVSSISTSRKSVQLILRFLNPHVHVYEEVLSAARTFPENDTRRGPST